MTQQCISQEARAPSLAVLVKIHTFPRCGLVIIQIARHILCFIRFWCGFVFQVVLFPTSTVYKAVDFTLALLYTNFKLQYLMNYSSDFND